MMSTDLAKGYYATMRDKVRDYPHPHFNQIELDLKRTFADESKERVAELIPPLSNVLTSFLKRNHTIGYC